MLTLAVFMLLVWNVRVLKGNSHQGCSATEKSHLLPIPFSKWCSPMAFGTKENSQEGYHLPKVTIFFLRKAPVAPSRKLKWFA